MGAPTSLESPHDQNATAQREQQALREAREEGAPGFFEEFALFLKENKKWWLIPMVGMFLIFVALAMLVAASPALQALIYPLI